MESLIRVIKNLISISSEEEKIVTALFKELSLQPGEYLLKEGEICRHVAFIDRGLVRYFINDDGNERTMYFNKEDDFVCNYQSFLPQIPSVQNIQALETSSFYTISFEKLQHFYKTVKEGEKLGRVAIEQVFISTIQQLNSLYTDPPATRYQQFLISYPALVQRIPQYYIASYVGITPQSLSRIRKKIAKIH